MAAPRCDELDRRLIALLVRDVRATNRELARATGLSEWSVASRLRRLREDKLLAASLVVDWRLAGYGCSAFALITQQGRDSDEISKALAARAWVQSGSRTLGAVELIAHVLARDLADLRARADELGELTGVAGVELLPIVEYHRYVVDRAPLPLARWNPRTLKSTELALDALDHRLMTCLIADAHQSNREIARQLKVSENTIRARLRRLEDSGLVRVLAMFDPFALGEAVLAYFALTVRGAARGKLIDWLSSRNDVPALASCLGRYDVVGVAITDSLEAAARLFETLRGRPGVESLAQFPVIGSPLHRFHLARLL